MTGRHAYGLALVLAAAGLGIFYYKAQVIGFPLAPGAESTVWTVQARFRIEAESGPVRAVLKVPHAPPGFSLLDENFVSRGYGLDIHEEGDSREARWTIRQAVGRQTLYYRAVVYADGNRAQSGPVPSFPQVPQLDEPYQTAMATLVAEVLQHSADVPSFTHELLLRLNDPTPDENVGLFLATAKSPTSRAQVAVTLLAGARTPARVAYGLSLGERERNAAFKPWLEVHDGKRWLHFDPKTGEQRLPSNFLIWWSGNEPLIAVAGADNPEVEMSVRGSTTASLEIAERRAELLGSRAIDFSLLGLPLQTQAVYAVMLLIPVGALVMVILRNVVGIKTFGIFMPVLVALAFRETRLWWGLILFGGVMLLGLTVRFYLEHLRLLAVPRMAALLTIVVLLLAGISVVSHQLRLERGLSVALFPLVILAMAIERLSIVWEERGPGEAGQEALGSLFVAAVSYLVMNVDLIEHLVFLFPELLLVVLAATLLLGRYRGYRLLELPRFQALRMKSD